MIRKKESLSASKKDERQAKNILQKYYNTPFGRTQKKKG